MIATPSAVTSTPREPRLSGPTMRVLLAAFLSVGLAAPFASANCVSKGLTQPQFSSLAQTSPAPPERAQPPALDSKTPVSIIGLWNLSFISGGEVVDVAFDAWHGDGTEILNDYTDPIEGNVCLGVWEQTGPRTYKLKHPSWYFDNNGTLLGTVVIHETVTVSTDGDSFSGSYTDDVYDVSGNLLEAYSGQLKASRIKPD